MWSVNVLPPLRPPRPCNFQLSTVVLKFLPNASRPLLCYQYRCQASAVTENLCSQEGLLLCEQCLPFWEEGLHIFLKWKSLARETQVNPCCWFSIVNQGVALLKLMRWTVFFYPNERLHLLVQIQGWWCFSQRQTGSEVFILRKLSLEPNGLPRVGSSWPTDAPLSGCCGHSSQPCLKCCHAPGDPQMRGVMLHRVVALT